MDRRHHCRAIVLGQGETIFAWWRIRQLRSIDARDKAMQALLTKGNPEPLIRALEDPQVRYHAASILTKMGRIAADPLAAALGRADMSKQALAVAAITLGELGDHRAADAMLAALRDPAVETWARAKAARLLGMLKLDAAKPQLVAMLSGSDEALAHAAGEALAAFGAYDDLVAAAPQHTAAIRGLGKLADKRATGFIINMLANNPAAEACLEALGAMRDARAVEPILKLMKELKVQAYTQGDRDWERRVLSRAADALRPLRDPRAHGPIGDLHVRERDFLSDKVTGRGISRLYVMHESSVKLLVATAWALSEYGDTNDISTLAMTAAALEKASGISDHHGARAVTEGRRALDWALKNLERQMEARADRRE